MAEEPESLTIEILRQIQAKLVQHDAYFEQIDRRFEHVQQQMDSRFERMQQQMDYRFDGVERKLGEVIDATTKALGSAAVANVRHDSVHVHPAEVELELRELRTRVRQLEEKV